MRSSRVLSLLLSVFLCFSIVLFPAAAAGDYWTLDDLESDPCQELEEIKGAGPVMDQTAAMSLYEVGEDTSMYSMSMMALDDSVSMAAEEGETKTTLSGSDFFSRLFLVSDTVAGLVCVYHEGLDVLGTHYPDWEEFRSSPANGSVPDSGYDYHNYFFYDTLCLTENLNGGEYRGFYGICVPPYDSDSSNGSVCYSLDLTDLGTFSSFELGGSFLPCLIVDSGNFYPSYIALYINGTLYKTIYPDSDYVYDFGIFQVDMTEDINSVEFYVHYPMTFISDSESVSYWVSFLSHNFFLTPDIGVQPFRQGILSGMGNIFQGIIELPGKIVSLLIDGLKSLFIPSENDMTALTGKYQQLLSERLGFIWQAYELVMNLFTGFMDALENGGSHEFTFPGIAFPFNGEELVLLPETPVSLDNELMDVIRPVLGTIVCFVAVAGFVNVAESMVIALISGISYYEFLHGKRGGSG